MSWADEYGGVWSPLRGNDGTLAWRDRLSVKAMNIESVRKV
jgi:hypothetical protein